MKIDAPALRWLPDHHAVIRMDAGAWPALPDGTGFRAVLHDEDETTVVAAVRDVTGLPATRRSEPWRILRLDGPLPHDAVGILARLATVLANEGVPIFALSTFGTDYVLVPSDRVRDAHRSLLDAGYTIHNAP
jgi:hypothetical protein